MKAEFMLRVAWVLLLHAAVSTPFRAHASEVEHSSNGTPELLTCFVVRTYYGHGAQYGDGSLKKLLSGLQKQQSRSRWVALLLVLDSRPFAELRRIVRDLDDERIWVFAELIAHKYNPKDGASWATGYHSKLYNLTDEAIRACPSSTEWVVITNGDNAYDGKFLKELATVPTSADVAAFNFYSRYQRPTANPCDRLAAAPGLPNCKENGMRFCQTDLAANAYRWRRMVEEDRRFGPLDPSGSSSANDGMMASLLLREGWKVHHVDGSKCLVNHSPNPQQCAAQQGNVWDDSGMAQPETFGGSCISKDYATRKMAAERDKYELVTIHVSHDPLSFDYHRFEGGVLLLECLRISDRRWWQQQYTFGRVCAASVDYSSLPADLPPHAWDSYLPPDEEGPKKAEL